MTGTGSEPEAVWQFFGRKPSGFFIDVGANDPVVNSQTWFLEQRGWSGILVEALPHLAEKLRANRPACRVFHAACGPPDHPETVDFHEAEAGGLSGLQQNPLGGDERYVATHKVPMLSLTEIIQEAGSPTVDFLSVDVEGAEFEVLRGLDLQRNGPALMLIEDHLFDLRAHRLMLEGGYRLVKRTGLNNWYVPRDTPFPFTTPMERLRLFRKVRLGTPLRGFKHRQELRRQKLGR